MKEIKITGTKWYVDIEYKENIARFCGEMCVDGFYATVNSCLLYTSPSPRD